MNLLIIPFHDWRKIIKEGFRTRDAHFIERFAPKKEIKKIIINRPITLLEIFVKKKSKRIKGDIVFKKKGFTLYRVMDNTYVIDYISKNIFKQILQKYKWYINTYAKSEYISFIKKSLNIIEVDDYYLVSQNIFAYKLAEKLNSNIKVFDAWDNFTKFNVYKSIQDIIEEGYLSYAKTSNFWITNARENIDFFSQRFHPQKIHLISNGVDLKRFVHNKAEKMPKDLSTVKRPVVGFGGKITQLLDTDLINNVVKGAPEISFVFVGQLLDKDVFAKIKKQSNFHYLGDKHYDTYPNYVKNFDVCIVPYVTLEEQKSGANSIKVYEYLATGKKVVGTYGNGLEELKEYLYLAKDTKEFLNEIQRFDNDKNKIDLNFHSWDNKVNSLIGLINNEINKQ